MTGRPRHSHKSKTPLSPVLRIAAVAAPLLTVAAIGVGVSDSGLVAQNAAFSAAPHAALPDDGIPLGEAMREERISRSGDRMAILARSGEPTRADLVRFTAAPLNVRTAPSIGSKVLDELQPGTKVRFTGLRTAGFAEIRFGQAYRWVTAEYLLRKKPATPESMGLSFAPCPDSGVESGLTAGAIRVYRAVCHNFPQITRYGGLGAGEHSTGRAIDIMTSDVTLGTQIAEFLRAHAAELNLYDVIWRQHIWTPQRAAEGWRAMSNRGSATANHYDHVHVSVN